jgi:hypothetical protein
VSEPTPGAPTAGQREDDLVERVVQRVDHPGLEDPGLDLKGEERRAWREYTELAGLLPYALEPEPAPPGQRQELLARVRGERPQHDARHDVAAVAPPSPGHSARRSVSLPLAAVLGALALGLALASGWLVRDRALQQATIAALERRLDSSAQTERELRDARAEAARLREVFTTAGVRSCPLRPWGERPAQPVARATVYYDGDHHQWFLAARDLEPCRQGSHYVLWFVVDGKPVPAGSFRPQRGVPVALQAQDLPSAAVSGVFLTLERDPSVATPTGPPILYGEESEEML